MSGAKSVEMTARLHVPVEPDRLERWRRESKAAGYSTLAEYVRRVLDGIEKVKPQADTKEGT